MEWCKKAFSSQRLGPFRVIQQLAALLLCEIQYSRKLINMTMIKKGR